MEEDWREELLGGRSSSVEVERVGGGRKDVRRQKQLSLTTHSIYRKEIMKHAIKESEIWMCT